MRKMLNADPFHGGPLETRSGVWPARWIGEPVPFDATPRVVAFRRKFHIDSQVSLTIHVSADERYELFLDGQRVGRGPERGDRENWFFESYVLDLEPGEHVLVARTWWLGPDCPAPYAQVTVRHGFLLAAQDHWLELLNTGRAKWDFKRLSGYEWMPTGQAWGCGCKLRIRGEKYDWGWETGAGQGWEAALPIADAVTFRANDEQRTWWLRPAVLPAMLDDPKQLGLVRLVSDAVHFPFHDDPYKPQPAVRISDCLPEEQLAWQSLLEGKASVTIPANTFRRLLVDLDDYVCAYPDLITQGGKEAIVRVSWAESLVDRLPRAGSHEWIGTMPKQNRNAIEGKFFHGVTDEFYPDGGDSRRFDTLWWEAGRYVQILIRAAEQPLTISKLKWRLTRYPSQSLAEFDASDPSLGPLVLPAIRALQECSHETFVDCPYYEQLMYVQDARLEALATYVSSPDCRLPRKAIELLDVSRDVSGLTQSRYPCRVSQRGWSFSLYWIGMVFEYLMWRGDIAFVKARMPGVRSVLDAALADLSDAGVVALVNRPDSGFMDSSPVFTGGPPSQGGWESSVLSMLLAWSLRIAQHLEEAVGEPELAARWGRKQREVTRAVTSTFWSEDRGLISDDRAGKHFSEHAQIFALLAESLPAELTKRVVDGLLGDPSLARTTIAFRYYLLEVLHRLRRTDLLIEHLDPWKDALFQGLRGLPEVPEPTRSDCHGWGSHVVYHFLASILGIRPATVGFKTVRIEPDLGSLKWAAGTMAHPLGAIHVRLERVDGRLGGRIGLPTGLTGQFIDGHRVVELHSGFQEF